MSFNQVENGLLARAIEELKPQWEKNYGPYPGEFYLGKPGLTFMILREGEDKGKLTVAKSLEGRLGPDPNITPVDCYNLMQPGEDIATAVARVLFGRPTAYTYAKG